MPTITTIASEDPATSLELSKLNGSSKKVEATPLDLSCSANGEGCVDFFINGAAVGANRININAVAVSQ